MFGKIRRLRTRDEQKNKAFTDEGRTEELGVYGRGTNRRIRHLQTTEWSEEIRRLRTRDEQKKKAFTDEG